MLTLVVLLLLHAASGEEASNKTISKKHSEKVLVKRQFAGAYGGVGFGGSDGCVTPPCGPAMGYYTQECNANKPCKNADKQFCQLGKCIDKLEENVACTKKGQCVTGKLCIYGRCKTGAATDNGVFCAKHSECEATKQCCTLVPAINPHFKICVPKLPKGHQCGGLGFTGCGGGSTFGFHAHNLHHDIAVDASEEGCTPCETEITARNECKEVGLISSLMICKDMA